MATLLIYEPHAMLSQKLRELLGREHRIFLFTEDSLPEEAFEQGEIPLVLLDARIRWADCRPLLERFAQRGCPVLFLSNDPSMTDHLKALYRPRSDVLIAPFSTKTLFAKVQGLLEEEPAPELTLVHEEHAALLNGRRVELTAQEYALLMALMENPDIPVSREQLLRKAWGYQSMGETRTVDVHVQRLRKKLGSEFIETVYRCGYRLKLLS